MNENKITSTVKNKSQGFARSFFIVVKPDVLIKTIANEGSVLTLQKNSFQVSFLETVSSFIFDKKLCPEKVQK